MKSNQKWFQGSKQTFILSSCSNRKRLFFFIFFYIYIYILKAMIDGEFGPHLYLFSQGDASAWLKAEEWLCSKTKWRPLKDKIRWLWLSRLTFYLCHLRQFTSGQAMLPMGAASISCNSWFDEVFLFITPFFRLKAKRKTKKCIKPFSKQENKQTKNK